MISRRAGAMLGLLAFSVAVAGGLYTDSTMMRTLERGLEALFLFSVLGFVLGCVAERVMHEYERTREAEFENHHVPGSDDKDVVSTGTSEGTSEGGLSGA